MQDLHLPPWPYPTLREVSPKVKEVDLQWNHYLRNGLGVTFLAVTQWSELAAKLSSEKKHFKRRLNVIKKLSDNAEEREQCHWLGLYMDRQVVTFLHNAQRFF